MNRVRLKKLVIQNFKSFAGRHEITFPENGLVALKGLNHETGGGSGAGKSNVILALAYAFKLCPYSAKSCQNWHTEAPMSVEVHMDTAEGEAVLKRGNELSLTVAGVSVKGAAKAVETRLDQLTGVPPGLREILTYRDQKWPKNILSMKDSDLKKFLTQLLGLESVEAEVAAANKRISAAETAWQVAKARAEEAGETAVQLANCVSPAPSPINDSLELDVASCAKSLSAAEGPAKAAAAAAQAAEFKMAGEIRKLRDARATRVLELGSADDIPIDGPGEAELSLRQNILQCRKHIETVKAKNKQALAQHDLKYAELTTSIKALERRVAQKPAMLKEAAELNRFIAQVKADICPTCERTWAAAAGKLTSYEEKLERVQADLQTIAENEPQLEALLLERSTLKFTPDPMLARLEEVEVDLKNKLRDLETARAISYNAAKEARRSKLAVETAKLDAELRVATSALNEEVARLKADANEKLAIVADARVFLTQAVGRLNAAKAEYEAKEELRLNQLQQVAKACHNEIELKHKADAAYVEFAREQDYADLVKGFRNKVFDEVLVSIGNEASNILAELPNAQHIAVEFRSERETLSGSVEQRIKPVVTIYGVDRGDFHEAMSGGQETSTALAVDLAVIRVVSQRLGCNLQWLVLDESFEGHDVPTKMACLELLQNYAQDRLVLIVDHATEVKEAFKQQIVVEYNKEQSWLKV